MLALPFPKVVDTVPSEEQPGGNSGCCGGCGCELRAEDVNSNEA